MEDERNIAYSSCLGAVYSDEVEHLVPTHDIGDSENGNADRIFVLGKDWMKVSVIASERTVSEMVTRYSPIDVISVWGHVNHGKKCLDKFVASIGSSIALGEACNLVTLVDPPDITDKKAMDILKKIFITERNTIVTGE